VNKARKLPSEEKKDIVKVLKRLARLSSLRLREIEKINELITSPILSLDQPINEWGGTLADVIPAQDDKETDPVEGAHQALLCGAIEEFLNNPKLITSREAEIIRGWLNKNQSYVEVADEKGVTRAAVHATMVRVRDRLTGLITDGKRTGLRGQKLTGKDRKMVQRLEAYWQES